MHIHIPETGSSYARSKVLVIGDDTRSFLASVRALHAHGCTVDALPFNPAAPALSSRAIRRVWSIKPPAGRMREWAKELADLIRRESYDFILPCCERSLIPIMENQALFSGFTIVFAGEKALKASLDKAAFHDLAQRLGLPVAPGRLLNLPHETAENLMAEFGLPLVVRETASYAPERLDERGQTHILRTREDLERFIAQADAHRRWHICAFFPAPGTGDGQGMGISVLADHGEVLVAFQHGRALEPKNGGGSSVRVSEPLDPQLLEGVRKLCAALELHGIAMFELRRNRKTGEAIFIELNARPWGSLPLAIRAGVNFPVLLHDLMVHGKRPEQPAYDAGVVMRNLILNAYDLFFRSGLPIRKRLFEGLHLGGEVIMALSGRHGTAAGFDTFEHGDMRPALREFTAMWHVLMQKGLARLGRKRTPVPAPTPALTAGENTAAQRAQEASSHGR
ncbi:ATP-grasp domain-containing protein [Thermopetrobacter sp. TC1]|uniref:carboxylate--amine ligase n=1 Tax=Thermopetrobacter sp. TC1 TaxID=1495045 RepID=UPI00068CC05E|nr:ATP-grasp domain-containing protein [Thermopetrobacter sp. TC1]